MVAVKTRQTFDAFVSHASGDSKIAAVLVRSLSKSGLTAWIDRSNVGFGQLLRNELHTAIRDSRSLVLLWSKAASRSRWVMAEVFVAFHQNRFIIPCVLDRTPLPQFLGNAAYLDRRRDGNRLGLELCRSVVTAPDHANEVAPLIASRTSVVSVADQRRGCRTVRSVSSGCDQPKEGSQGQCLGQ